MKVETTGATSRLRDFDFKTFRDFFRPRDQKTSRAMAPVASPSLPLLILTWKLKKLPFGSNTFEFLKEWWYCISYKHVCNCKKKEAKIFYMNKYMWSSIIGILTIPGIILRSLKSKKFFYYW